MLKVTAQDESGNTKNYVYQTIYTLFASFLKKRFAFSESSCIIQTGFSSFESIQTKILEGIEGVRHSSAILPVKSIDINRIMNHRKERNVL